MKKVLLAIGLGVVCGMMSACVSSGPARNARSPLEIESLPAKEQAYLAALARATWDSIDYMAHPKTHLPYDNSAKIRQDDRQTSVSNIGLYAADIVAAYELGYLDRPEAIRRLSLLVDSLNAFRKWRGWTQSWNDIETLQPNTYDRWVSVLDTGNLVAGLITARAAFPEVREQISQFIDDMDWSWMTDPEQQKVRFGYNTGSGEMGGAMGDLGSDNRLAAFFAMAAGALPPESWEKVGRALEERYGLHYFTPGWQGGGLFMPFLGGIFLDDSGTIMGRAQANFAYAQIVHADRIGSPVWGWSASDSPDQGYRGFGGITDEVVTPHACVLAIQYYPRKVLRNLHRLEELGAREPCRVDGVQRDFGFRDALNVQTLKTTPNYLVLDQSMLFLSLANYIKKDAVRSIFQSDPLVVVGRGMATDYREARELDETITIAGRDRADRTDPVIPLDLGVPMFSVRRYTESCRLEMPVTRTQQSIVIDGDMADWSHVSLTRISPRGHLEFGSVSSEDDLAGAFGFQWDDEHLYLVARLEDDALLNERRDADIWKDDCVEFFIDPGDDGFAWGNPGDFQIGLAPAEGGTALRKWSWFQQGDPEENITGAIRQLASADSGCVIEAAIRWDYLGIEPETGRQFGLSAAFHDVDEVDEKPGCKISWSYLLDGKHLGLITLE